MGETDCVPKLIGGDVELGNFILGPGEAQRMSDCEASRRLLDEVDGLPRRSLRYSDPWAAAMAGDFNAGYAVGGGRHSDAGSQDFGRRYLYDNGGCIYIDLNHLELATPEVLSARDYQAVWAAMLRIARRAQVAANSELPSDRQIVVLANNSDRQGNSYGGHQSFLMGRTTWDDMMRRRMIPSLFQLMAFQASSIVYTGQGKVGSENGHAPVPFQISQRADFIETLVGEQTTYNRPMVNTRDEPLCGRKGRHGNAALPGSRYARLHVIFYDTNLAPVATYLKVGVMQLFLAMVEARSIHESLVLEDPLAALHGWSQNPDLDVAMPLCCGQRLTAVELQMKFLEQARTFDARGGFDEVVCGAGEILSLWEDTLSKLQSRAYGDLRGRIDWIMKRCILEEALAEHQQWCWESPELRYLDQIYASLDPSGSVFLSLQEAGMYEPVATEAEIAHYETNPPADTRAWTRAMLLRAAGPGLVSHVDWDRIELRATGTRGLRTFVGLAEPLGATRAETHDIFAAAEAMPDLLAALHSAGAVTLTHPQIKPVYPLNQAVECYDPLTYAPD